MSSVEILQYGAVVAFALAVGCAIWCVIIFFRQDIRGVIGDLTGKTVAREVSQMRQEAKQNELSHRGNKEKNSITAMHSTKRDATVVSKEEDATVLLQQYESTTLLTQGEETVLLSDTDNTMLLEVDEGTMVLRQQELQMPKIELQIIDTIMVIHTDGIIA